MGRSARGAEDNEALERLLAVSPVGIFRTDARGNCRYVNKRWTEISGLSLEAATGEGWIHAIHPADRERVIDEWYRCVAERRPFSLEYRFMRADGQVRWVLARAEEERRDSGAIAGYVGIITDITSLKDVERELRAREAMLSRSEMIAQLGSWDLDIPTGRLSGSDGTFRIFGLRREEFGGTVAAFLERVHPDDRERVAQAVAATLEQGVHYDIDFRTVAGDGSVRHVHAEDIVELDATGKPVRVRGIVQDITGRKQVEEALREEKQRLGLLTENLPAMIAYIDSDCRYRYANLRYRLFYAGSETSIEGRKMAQVLTPETWDTVSAPVLRALGGEAQNYTGARRLHDGSLRYVSVSLVPHRADSGAVLGIYVLAMDITEQHRAELALREREAGLRHAQEMAAIAYVVVRPDGVYERWSESWPRLMGIGPERLPRTTREGLQFVHPEDRERFRSVAIESARARQRVTLEYRFIRRDGSVAQVRQTMEPFGEPGDDGRSYWFVTLQDVTELKRAVEAVASTARALRLLSDCNAALIRATSEPELLNEICRVLVRGGGYRLAWVGAREHDERASVRRLASHGDDKGYLDRIAATWRDDERGQGPTGTALRTGTTQLNRDSATNPAMRLWREEALSRGYRSSLALPLVAEGEILGALSIYAAEADAFEAGEIALLEEAAANIAFGIAALRTRAERERLTRVHAMLSGINAAIVRIRDRQELFDEVCRLAVEAGGFRLSWIGLIDKAAMRLRPVAWAGAAEGFFDAMPAAVTELGPQAKALTGRAIAQVKPLFCNDVRADPERTMKREMAERGINSFAVLPLVVGDEVAGILDLYAGDTGFFDEQEMRLLGELAGDVAFALDHIEKEEKVRYLAYYDPLTGLANRSLFMERLAQQAGAARREGHSFALAITNIERFRAINDAFGRQFADALLRQVGARLAELAGDAGYVARVGADLFAVMVPRARSEEALAQIMERAARRMDEPYAIEGKEVRITGRAGAALFPADARDAESLFRNAEAALKRVAPGEHYRFYTPEMTDRVAERVTLEHRLRRAVDHEEFVLYYQPKVDVTSRRISGAEALIRWQSPERGLVPPMEFISMLEDTGLILEVGTWALRRAALERRRWLELGLEAPRVAVNVSPIQLRHRDFVGVVKAALTAGASPAGIDLEITESLIMEDVASSVAKLVELRALGVEIAVDDFGTGYSSLGYLAKLPVQALKIDRAFIVAMLANRDTMTLVQTIVALAQSLRLKVIAEGVETEEQARVLRSLGCDQMQGYLFSKPLPAQEFEALLRRRP